MARARTDLPGAWQDRYGSRTEPGTGSRAAEAKLIFASLPPYLSESGVYEAILSAQVPFEFADGPLDGGVDRQLLLGHLGDGDRD